MRRRIRRAGAGLAVAVLGLADREATSRRERATDRRKAHAAHGVLHHRARRVWANCPERATRNWIDHFQGLVEGSSTGVVP
jgi:hypothetical protein